MILGWRFNHRSTCVAVRLRLMFLCTAKLNSDGLINEKKIWGPTWRHWNSPTSAILISYDQAVLFYTWPTPSHHFVLRWKFVGHWLLWSFKKRLSWKNLSEFSPTRPLTTFVQNTRIVLPKRHHHHIQVLEPTLEHFWSQLSLSKSCPTAFITFSLNIVKHIC